MNEISAKIILDSVNPNGDRLTTMQLTYPRFVHSEIMTHRAFTRNAASSRAIPIEKMIKWVEENPAGPVRWGTNGKGMQDHGEFTGEDAEVRRQWWLRSAKAAVAQAKEGELLGLHKQIVNRVLEPFAWMVTLVSCTDWENFFSLRSHKDAQPEFQRVADLALDSYVNSSPRPTKWLEWHLPYGDRMPEGMTIEQQIAISSARAARVSYVTQDGEINSEKDFILHDSLSANGHFSPLEHPAVAVPGRHANFNGWCQHRRFFKNENRKCNLPELLKSRQSANGK